jgi:hypothetical protein
LCSCSSQRIALQQGRSLRGVTSGAAFTASDTSIQPRLAHEDDNGSGVDEVAVVTEVVENRGYDEEFDESLVISTIPAPEMTMDTTPSPSPASHHKDVKGGHDAAVAESPSPIAAPHHHMKNSTHDPTNASKKDPTPASSTAPEEKKRTDGGNDAAGTESQSPIDVDPTQELTTVQKKDPAPAPITAAKEKKRATDDDDNQVDDTAEEKETDGSISNFDIGVSEEPSNDDDRPSGEVTDDVPQEKLSSPQDNNSNLPTKKPSGTELNEKDHIEIIEDDLVARDDDGLEEELQEEETETKVFGWSGFLISLVAMVFTAHQISENPDGIFASVLCRPAITIVSCVIKAVLMPFRYMLGYREYDSGHMPISTTDPYRCDVR